MKEHLVLLIHGLQGNVGHMEYLEKKLKTANPKILTINARANDQGWFKSGPFKNWWTSSDGISKGGDRIIAELKEILSNTNDVQSLRTISFIGSSMGGVYARYIAGRLYKSENNKISITLNTNNELNLEPLNYVSLASPHVGVAGLQGLHLYVGTSLWFFRGTASDLALTDHPSNPLLYEMASLDSSYFLALKSFSKRITYASCSAQEWKVPYSTSAIVPWVWASAPQDPMIVNTHHDNEGIPEAPSNCIERYCDDPKVETIIKNLRTLSWTRVDVNLLHSQAAVVNANRDQIAVHLLDQLVGLT